MVSFVGAIRKKRQKTIPFQSEVEVCFDVPSFKSYCCHRPIWLGYLSSFFPSSSSWPHLPLLLLLLLFLPLFLVRLFLRFSMSWTVRDRVWFVIFDSSRSYFSSFSHPFFLSFAFSFPPSLIVFISHKHFFLNVEPKRRTKGTIIDDDGAGVCDCELFANTKTPQTPSSVNEPKPKDQAFKRNVLGEIKRKENQENRICLSSIRFDSRSPLLQIRLLRTKKNREQNKRKKRT